MESVSQPGAPANPVPADYRPVDLWGKFDPPPLPLGLLPTAIEQFATVMAAHMGADPAGLAMAALTVCAAAIPDSVQLQVKHHDPGWKESARIWTALIGLPSTKKSPIIDAAVRPLTKIDNRMVREWQSKWARWNALEKAEKAATPEPLQIRKRIEDTTIEALQEVMRGSPDGVLCVRDELSGWFGSMEKYSGGGKAGATDRAVWLQTFNGGVYSINRIGRGVTVLPNLSVSLLGGIQPDAIRKIAADATDDGLLQRLFPIVLQPATVGQDAPMPPVAEIYEFTIMMLLGVRAPVGLRFSDGAQACRRGLEAHHARLAAVELINPKLASHIGKLDGLFARLCVIWHAVENMGLGTLPEAVTESVASLVAEFMRRFLLPHALAFYAGVLDLSNDDDRLKAVAGRILAHGLSQITVRDVARSVHSMRKLTAREIVPVLEQLAALNWLSEVPGPRTTSDPIFLVNPEVHRLFAERGAAEKASRNAARAALQELAGR